MISKNTIPLGYVELTNGSKAIYPMNDIFLNFTFEIEEHWEALRLAVNLLLESYKQQNPDTKAKLIKGSIRVRTQFQYLLDIQNTTRDQDIKLTEDEAEATYIEFQNRARSDIPIEIRSVEYFGLGIGHSRGKIANQIWVLAEDVDLVLRGRTFARYILKDEITNDEHPATSGIMYVSLTKLSEEGSPAGELASFLLGKLKNPQNEAVKKIVKAFNSSFEAFKADKEAINVLSAGERGRLEGRLEGKEEVRLEIALKLLALKIPKAQISQATGLSTDEISNIELENAEQGLKTSLTQGRR